MAKGPGPYSGGSPGLKPAPKKKPKPKKKEVTGPYQDQSSNPEIRARATPHEHRKVRVRKKKDPLKLKGPLKLKTPRGGKAKDSGFDDLSPILDAIKDAYEGNELTGPNPVRDYVESTAKTAKQAVKDRLDVEKLITDPAGTPAQRETAANIVSLVPAGKAAKTATKALEEAATNAPSAAKLAERAAKAAKAAPKKKVARLKSAPQRAARRAKETPKKIKTAPRRAKRAATTPEGRRAVAKGTGRKAARHPFASFGGAGVLANQSGTEIPGLHEAGAFVEGHVNALKDNPEQTLKTTARAIPGIVTGPAALLGSAGASVLHGTPKPLVTEADKQLTGLKDMGEKLLSGDPKTVQKSVEDEVGLSVVAPLPAISRFGKTKVYKQGRGKVRAKVEGKRSGTRSKRRGELRDFKTGTRTKRPRKIRHAVPDTLTGEPRVLRRTGKVIEGHRQRKTVAKDTARRKAQGERAASLAAKEVVNYVRKSKLPTKGEHNIGDVLATVAQYGISRKKERAMRQLDEIEASIGKVDPDELPAGTITDLRNIKYLRDHPEAFTDRNFWHAVDAYKRQAKEIETSGRKKVLAVGDVYGLARPEERLEAGVKVNGRTVRHDFYKDEAPLQRKQAELGEIRQDAQRLEAAVAGKVSAEDKARAAHIAAQMQAKAKGLERELKDYRSGFKQAQKDYGREAQATIREKGLEQPAYVKDVKPRQGLEPLPNFPGGRSARKQHMAGIEQSRRGVTMARDFETLVNQSIAEPRMRRAMHEATTDFAETWATPVNGKRYLTSEEINRAINRGELDEGQYAVLHSQFFKQAMLDPYKKHDEFSGDVRAALDTPISTEIRGRANDPGNKYVVVPKEALREFVHQMEPPKGMDKLFGGANRMLSRVILGYSPGWAVAQLIAEGIPASIAIGLNPARWARVAKYMAREDKRLNRKDRAAIDGMAGESAGVTPHPQVQFKPDTNMMASRFFRLSNRNRVGRALLKGASGEALGVFDRWKGGKYRKAVAAAKADRELNGFVKSLGQLMKGQRSIVETIKGKPLKEQMAYIANHPKEAAKLEQYLDDVMGNWRALTRHEAKFAPLVVFYPFVRYSLRWMFWSFPKEHPVKASVLYFLAQQNANELEKLAGGPVDFLNYTVPAYTSSDGDNAVLPGGSRIAPGMNAITQSIGRGQIESLAGALNPAAGVAVSAITGVDPLSGEKKAHSPLEHGLLGLNSLLSMFPPARLADLNRVGQDEPSGVSKAFDKMDPLRDERSAVFPFLPQSGERFGDSARLGRALDKSSFDPEFGMDWVMEAAKEAAAGNTARATRIIKRREGSDKASDEISALVEEYVGKEGRLPDLSKKEGEWVNQITGKMMIPVESPKEKRKKEAKENPFGLPSTDASDLRKQFGLPSTSTADLRKQFGIE